MSIEMESGTVLDFASEDAAIEHILHELHDAVPLTEFNRVATQLHSSGTVRIEGSTFFITRDPEQFYRLTWRERNAEDQGRKAA